MNSISQDVIRLLSQASNHTDDKIETFAVHDSQKANENKPILNLIHYRERLVARWLPQNTKKTDHYH